MVVGRGMSSQTFCQMTSHTAPLTLSQADVLRKILEEDGYEFFAKGYTLYAAKKGKLNIAVYQKGPKVLIQGKDTEDFIKFTLEPRVLGEARLGYEEVHDPEHFSPHFGIDESGKGDFFGPLVIAGVYTDGEITRHLIASGIMDSKKIGGAKKIRQLAKVIRETPGIAHQVISVGPAKYNEIYGSFKNLNRLLAWGHAAVIEKLVAQRPDCPRALSDQFARAEVLERALKQKNVALVLDQRTKGESDTAVAAASILARERFIDWMDATSKNLGFTLPLGASAAVVAAGKRLVKERGEESLSQAAKLHFKTTLQVLGKG